MCKPTAKLAITVVVASFCLGAPRIAEAKSPSPADGTIENLLKKRGYAKRVDADVPGNVIAVMEDLTTEVFELAVKAAFENNKKILPRHLRQAIKNIGKDKKKLLTGGRNKVGLGS